MTVETILPWVMAECGLDDITADISTQDFQMRQINALMTQAGKDINTRAEWSKARKTVTLVAGDTFALPDDFQEIASAGAVTLIAGATPRIVRDPALWQLLKATPSAQTYYTLDSGNIDFSPTIPDDGATYRYISKNWIVGDKAAITENDDVTIFPEELLARGTIWRWKRQKGLPYEDALAEFEADLETAYQADRGIA